MVPLAFKPIQMQIKTLPYIILSRRARILKRLFNDSPRYGYGDMNGSDDQNKRSILFLSSATWPEPNATAAGIRTNSLIEMFSKSNLFTSVHFGCGAAVPSSFHVDSFNKANDVYWHPVKLNRESEMKLFLNSIQDQFGPIKAVIFDRFYSEEAFSFIIKDTCCDAVRILDMQDVHSLRIGRQNLVEEFDREMTYDFGDVALASSLMDRVMSFDPKDNYQDVDPPLLDKHKAKSYDVFLRELASIHRSDLVLVCSSAEMELLRSWSVPTWKLALASFFCDKTIHEQMPSFRDRCDFVTIGGFKHPPNIDSVKLLKHTIWPRIRSRLNGCNIRLHIYGAYPPQEILALHDIESGFLVHGRIDDVDNELRKGRVLLAPLRFGAGIKGKIVDSWRSGCPVIATPIGAEGMMDDMQGLGWGGAVASDENTFVEAAVGMYKDIAVWNTAQNRGAILLNELFNKEQNFKLVEREVSEALSELHQRRKFDTTSAMLWHQRMRSTKYFSKWIECKETK